MFRSEARRRIAPSSARSSAFPLLHGAALVALLVGGLKADSSEAVQRTWINPLGGSAGTAANWSAAAVPSAFDTLLFNLANTYPVTFGLNVPTTHQISVRDGAVNFNFGTAHIHTGSLHVSVVPALPSTLDIASGRLALQNSVVLGLGVGTDGTLRITGSGTDVSQTAPSGALRIGYGEGVGRLSVSDGGLLQTDATIELAGGPLATAVGTLRVSGEGSSPQTRRSTFTALPNYTNEMWVGFYGTGTVEVRDGALMTVERSLVLAADFGSSGTLRVTGPGILDSARVVVTQDMLIGRRVDGLLAGSGEVIVEAGGVVDVAGSTYTYDDLPGAGGTLTISEGGRYATGSLYVDDPETDLLLNGGKLQIVGGTVNTIAQPFTVNSALGSPVVQLLDGAVCALSSAPTPAIRVGTTGQGRLDVMSGSQLITNSKAISVGVSSGGTGTLLVDDAAVSTNASLRVGSGGTGTLTVRNGASVNAFDLELASSGSGNGTMTVTDAGTTVSVTNALYGSGLASAASGAPSTLTVSAGGRLNLDRAGVCGTVWDDCTLRVNSGGVLGLNGDLNVNGVVEFNGGTSSGGGILLRQAGVLSGSGTLPSKVASSADTTTEVRATGPWTLGRADQPAGIKLSGWLRVDQHLVTLLDSDSAEVARISLIGGRLVMPTAGGSFSRLTGSGQIDGNARNRGTIIADASPGVAFAGLLESYGRPVSGTLRFLAGGGFKGRGTLAGSVYVDSGAVMSNDGSLTVGDLSAPGIVDIRGTLECGASTLTLAPIDTTQVRGSILLQLGTLATTPTRSMRVHEGGALIGAGTCTIKTIMDGTVAPGDPSGSNFGTLTMTQVVMRSTGKLVVEVGNVGLGVVDRLVGMTRIDVAGALDIRRVGLSVNPGDSIQIISAAVRVGAFTTLTLDGGPVNGFYELRYKTDGVWVVFPNGLVDVTPTGQSVVPKAFAFATLGSPGVSPQLELAMPVAGRVQIEVFDLRGRRVEVVVDGELAAGRHRFTQGLAQLPHGEVCFARARVSGAEAPFSRVVRLIRLR